MWNQRRLPRLPAPHYCGFAYVFWTSVIKDRATGWLTRDFHGQFREILLHTLTRYRLTCPIYTLMPDHFHLIWIGAHPSANQLNASRFLRTHLDLTFEKQPHDHVLREEERTHDAFLKTCTYILHNPVRAGLVETPQDWPYCARMIPGFPSLRRDPLSQFWKCHHAYQQQLAEMTQA